MQRTKSLEFAPNLVHNYAAEEFIVKAKKKKKKPKKTSSQDNSENKNSFIVNGHGSTSTQNGKESHLFSASSSHTLGKNSHEPPSALAPKILFSSPHRRTRSDSHTQVNSQSADDQNTQGEVQKTTTGEQPIVPLEIENPPWSFFSTLRTEVSGATNSLTEEADTSEEKRLLIENFLVKLPKELEQFLWFGYFVCLEQFLYFFTFLPLQVLALPFTFLYRHQFSSTQKYAIHLVLLLLPALYIVLNISHLRDASVAYHYIRNQNVLKLYVIFNVLEVFDRLLNIFGTDLLGWVEPGSTYGFFGDRKNRSLWLKILTGIFKRSLGILYVVLHCMVLLYQCIAMNVAFNSESGLLLTLLVSNQFVELKGSVFKKSEEKNLFQIVTSDICERFQLGIFLIVVAVHNLSYIQWNLNPEEISKLLASSILVLSSELFVDWLKHAFVTRFNNHSPSVYRKFGLCVSKQLVVAKNSPNSSPPKKVWVALNSARATRILNFNSLPLVCLVLRTVYVIWPDPAQVLFYSPSWDLNLAVFFGVFFILCLSKIYLHRILVFFATKYQMQEMAENEKTKEE